MDTPVHAASNHPSDEEVDALIHELRSADIVVRRRAAERLLALGPEATSNRAATELASQLVLDDLDLSCTALIALAGLGVEARHTAGRISEALDSRHEDVRLRAAVALAHVGGPLQDDALAILAEALRSQDQGVEEAAVAALGMVGQPALSVLLEGLGDPVPHVRLLAAKAIWLLGPAGEPAGSTLSRSLQDQDSFVREAAAVALGSVQCRRPEVVVALAQALGDEASQVRWQAAYALSCLGPAAEPAIESLSAALRDPLIRSTAATSLVRVGRPALPVLRRSLRSNDRGICLTVLRSVREEKQLIAELAPEIVATFGEESVEHEAILTLVALGPASVAHLLSVLSSVGNVPSKLAAISGLERLGDSAIDAIDELRSVAHTDSAPEVREAALMAVQRIQSAADRRAVDSAPNSSAAHAGE